MTRCFGITFYLSICIHISDEGKFIYKLIRSNQDICKTLEIGCAYGLSSLHICFALSERKSPKHIIIDPNQNKYWHGVGISNLQRAGYNFYDFIEQPSEFALPDLSQNESGTFDMVFIDGWHTFDHTLLDLFYANKLIKIGGYIVIDDCTLPSVAKAVSYILKYPAYKIEAQSMPRKTLKRILANIIKVVITPSLAGYLLPRNIYDRFYVRTLYSSMVALRKMKHDERGWTWFKPF